MTTPEGKTKDRIKTVLKSFEPQLYYHMPVQNGMGAPTLDFIVCVNGVYVTIEAKAWQEGKEPTKRQKETMAEVDGAGGFVFVVDDEASLAVLQAYLELLALPLPK